MKVSTPTVSREDQLSFAKVEKLRGVDPDDIRRALQMVCGDKTLDRSTISSVEASLDAVDTEDQISYVKIETYRKINPIMDVHRSVQKVCGGQTFSSSTYSRWSTRFKQGKSVRLGYEKPITDAQAVQRLKKLINKNETTLSEKGESSKTTEHSGDESDEARSS